MSRLKNRPRHRWTDAEKEQLIRDIGEPAILVNACREHGVNDSWFRRMKRTYLAGHPDFQMKTTKHGWSSDPEQRSREMKRRRARWKSAQVNPPNNAELKAAVTAYKQLPRDQKRPFRDAHKLSGPQMSTILRGVATPMIQARMLTNGNETLRDMRLATIPDEIPVMNLVPNSSPPVASVPVTLDDAIRAVEVKLDHMREFTDHLKRMQRGGRLA